MTTMTFVVTTTIAAIQAKPENEMLPLREIIKKSLLLMESPSTTSPPNSDASLKAYVGGKSLPKIKMERWNQADLSYFDLHINRAHEEDEIVWVEKNVYYRNIVFFV